MNKDLMERVEGEIILDVYTNHKDQLVPITDVPPSIAGHWILEVGCKFDEISSGDAVIVRVDDIQGKVFVLVGLTFKENEDYYLMELKGGA